MSDVADVMEMVRGLVNGSGPRILQVDYPPPKSVASGPAFICHAHYVEVMAEGLLRCAYALVESEKRQRAMAATMGMATALTPAPVILDGMGFERKAKRA